MCWGGAGGTLNSTQASSGSACKSAGTATLTDVRVLTAATDPCLCPLPLVPQSGNPSTYMSHLPVHMDGSCNGLQHYAALGRDEAGGKAVNLLPSDKPQDVYKVCMCVWEGPFQGVWLTGSARVVGSSRLN